MKKTILLTIIMGIFLACNIFAQTFDRTYGSTDTDFGERISENQEVLPDGWTIPAGNFVGSTDFRNNGTIEYVGSCMWTGMSDVYVVGNNVWCSFADGPWHIDISDISNPVFLSRVYTPFYTLKQGEIMGSNDILVEGDYTYIGDHEGVRIVNINNMELISTYSLRRAHTLYLRNNNLYVCDGTGFWVLDVSDPAEPDSIGFYEKPAAVGLDIVGDYAYISSTSGMILTILDISNPENPTFVSELEIIGVCPCGNQIIVENGYAYIAGGAGGFHIVDVSDPANPVFKLSIDFDGSVTRIATINPQYVVISVSTPSSIEVIDVSDPVNPFVAASYGGSGDLFLSENRLFIVSSNSISIQDVQDPLNFSYLGSIDVEVYYSRGVRVSGNFAYIVDGGDWFNPSLNIVDISDPYNPFTRGNYSIGYPAWSTNLDVKDGYVYVIEKMSEKVKIIDVSDPDLPVLAGEYATSVAAEDIFVGNPYTYLLVDKDLQIVDLQDPSNPSLVSSITLGAETVKIIYVDNGYAYIGDDIGDVWIIDVSDSLSPFVVSTFNTAAATTGIFTAGNSLYVVSQEELQIVDISNINSPVIVGSYLDTDLSSYSTICVETGYAFIVNNIGGFIKIDVSDPTAPFREEFYQTAGWCRDLAYANDHLYITTDRSFQVLKDGSIQGIGDENRSILSNYSLSQNRPNPFNLSTTISYQLKEPGEVIFNIYNLQGQLVIKLVDSRQSSGRHSVVWDGRDDSGNPVSSGIYFYQIKLNDNISVTKKMLLLSRL
jgi:hypothetical protein